MAGDPRAAAIASLSTQDENDCGFVDILDFPLNPPDGDGVARGGTDFGVYRSRYEQYHTGEDWWTSRGRSSFGAPVYSIGHGRVTYAAPLGWGRDQGTIVVRHTFADGRQLLSFYGHLDPPSVTLRAGDCVRRGQKIGEIGRPRTPPHLHFEIRSHMPNEPGGGYWWQDPTLDGWFPPSQTIWQERLRSAPGVDWFRAPGQRDSVAVGLRDEEAYVLLEEEQIIGLDPENGEQLWSVHPDLRAETAVLDASRPLVYVGDQLGRVQAIPLPRTNDGADSAETTGVPEALWQVDLDVVGIPQMIPLPAGGIMMVVWNDAIGLSADGEVIWRSDAFDRLIDWAQIDDRLLVTTVGREGSVWSVGQSAPRLWKDISGGSLAEQGDDVLLFNPDGLFRLNPVDESSTLLSDWPKDSLRASAVLGVEDDGALVAYLSRLERRLIHFDAEGNIVWQRSIPDDVMGTPRLLAIGNVPYLIASGESSGTGTVSVYAIDLEQAILTHLFRGGTRTPSFSSNSIHESGTSRIFLNIGGGHLVCLDLPSATEAVFTEADSLPQ